MRAPRDVHCSDLTSMGIYIGRRDFPGKARARGRSARRARAGAAGGWLGHELLGAEWKERRANFRFARRIFQTSEEFRAAQFTVGVVAACSENVAVV